MSNIRQIIKNEIIENKSTIETLQWSIMNSIGSLVFAGFIKNIKVKEYPGTHYLFPTIRSISNFLDMNNEFMKHLSDHMVEYMAINKWIVTHNDNECLKLFSRENIEILKSIVDAYILPNVSRTIPSTITKKFQLDDESLRGLIDTSYEIDLFPSAIPESYYVYIIEETCLQLMRMIDSIDKLIITCDDDTYRVKVGRNDILSIDHTAAICEMLMSTQMFIDKNIMDLFGFVTTTSLVNYDKDTMECTVSTSINNKVSIYRLN